MAQTGPSTREKLRVLIADDVQETRRNTRLMIATLDHVEVVAIASNGLQAVEMTREHHPDIVILDVNMPEMDGLTAFRNIVRIYPYMGCIIISAENDKATLQMAKSIGVQEYLIKPFIIQELESAVDRVSVYIKEARRKYDQTEETRKKAIASLEQQAAEHMKAKRTDDEALHVYEQLADHLDCSPRWLKALVMIYVIRQDWGRLKMTAARLEQLSNK
ncbi:MAG: response regulator [Chloroflexi bacterium]|nr:response regulator [Chloroflexota bacterium]